MSTTAATELALAPDPNQTINSRIVFTQGGKGGVGKTAFITLLVDWYAKQGIRYTLLDSDTENKIRGSLSQYFHQAHKVDIHTPSGLDTFIDVLDEEAPLVIADMGAGSGAVAHR